ncbi:hypothetical protein H1P_310027 [Hyella patelloides LEGE 07179]|uniref:DUF6311 domain-containing protein n=1 Tax=Hyella patelloides LEGE 07179 TaxID=945734 RepID=A0A563VUH4_9CYAN|nr:hypothetical protein H1P_310027 [Hyella patelloides LEGE 07179]
MNKKNINNFIVLLVGLCLGFLYTTYLLGDQILPFNSEWLFTLNRELTQSYLGWLFFRFDYWHWPLTLLIILYILLKLQ